jgi:hypothetical protein
VSVGHAPGTYGNGNHVVRMPIVEAPGDPVPGLATFRVPIERILLRPNVPCGMDYAVIGGMLKRLRTSREDCDPVSVTPEGENFRLDDGRHRFFAAVIAGRTDILAQAT